MKILRVATDTGQIHEVLEVETLGDAVPQDGETFFLLASYPELCGVDEERLVEEFTFNFVGGKWCRAAAAVPLDVLKDDKLTEIRSRFNEALSGGYTTQAGVKLDCDFGSISRLTSLMNLAQAAGMDDLEIRDYDNVTHSTNLAGLTAMLVEMGGYVQECFRKKWTLSDAIGEASTPDEVAQVAWS